MRFQEGNTVFYKLWRLFRTYVLTLARFDLCLQGALLIIILLEHNVYLLLQRDAADGHLHGLIKDWVYMGCAVLEFLLGAPLAWWGRRWRQFTLSVWLLATATSGLLVLAFPYKDESPINVETCGGDIVTPYSTILNTALTDSTTIARITLLIITALLCALTRISIWAHGITYLDDHEPQSGPYFYGILISIRLSLGLNGINWFTPGSRREDWWVAQITVSMLTLMFAIFFTLFPRKMPQYKEIEEWQDSSKFSKQDFLSSVRRVILNKAVVIQTVAMSFMHAALFCFIRYDDKYVQAQFRAETVRSDLRTSRFPGDIFRSMVIISFVAIFRARFSGRRSDGVNAKTASMVGGGMAILAGVFFVVLATLQCDVGELAGLDSEGYEQPTCSQHCGCNSQVYGYSPVCALDTDITYFSPCHAGCAEFEDLKGFVMFYNCTCGTERAIRGGCMLYSCRLVFSLYQVFFAIVVAFSGSSLLMQGMVLLRSVTRSDKPVAIGIGFGLVALLANVLGNGLYMTISYLTCAFFRNGACIFHQTTMWSMPVTSAGLCLISAAVSLVASRANDAKNDT